MTALSNAEKCRQSADNLLRRLTVQLTYSQHIPLTLHQNTMNRALQTSSDSLPFYSNDTVICRYMKFQLWLFFFINQWYRSTGTLSYDFLTGDISCKKRVSIPQVVQTRDLSGKRYKTCKTSSFRTAHYLLQVYIPLLVMIFLSAFIPYCLK